MKHIKEWNEITFEVDDYFDEDGELEFSIKSHGETKSIWINREDIIYLTSHLVKVLAG